LMRLFLLYIRSDCCSSHRISVSTMDGALLKDVSRNSYRWKVVVRIARMWEFRSADQEILYEIGFVALDRQVSSCRLYIDLLFLIHCLC
jgi:hypothetical protein